MSKTGRSALLLMDFQQGIAERLDEQTRERVVSAAAVSAEAARKQGIPVIHVRTCFRPGHPEVNPRNKRLTEVAAAGALISGTDAVAYVEPLRPLPGEITVDKQRVSALADTGLGAVLRGLDVTSLILGGLTTSGVVLSTLRSAIDLDYAVTVLEPCCADIEQVVHDTLMSRVFPTHAHVQNAPLERTPE